MRRGPLEIGQVFVGERRHAQARPRHIDPLIRANVSRQRDLEPRPARASSHNIHRDRAVGEKNALPHIQVVGQGAIGRGQAMGVVFSPALAHQDKLGVVIAVDHTTHDLTQPDLGAAQILQDGDLGLGLRGDPTDQSRVWPYGLRAMPCEKLSRKTSTPASTICLMTSGSVDAGPTVATILVRTFPAALYGGIS